MGSSAEHTALINSTCETLAIAGYLAWPNQTGAAFRDGRFLKYGKLGSGDIIMVLSPDGRHGEGEGKTGDAIQRKEQKIHQKSIEKRGALYFVFHTPDELISQLIAAGYPPPNT